MKKLILCITVLALGTLASLEIEAAGVKSGKTKKWNCTINAVTDAHCRKIADLGSDLCESPYEHSGCDVVTVICPNGTTHEQEC